jgi:23S rRNA pseudouridine2605 synthase
MKFQIADLRLKIGIADLQIFKSILNLKSQILNPMVRLQKILSLAGVASRRASEQLMLDGRVTVNGETVRELGTRADPAVDDIRVDGRRIKLPERHRYLLLHKPRGYVTTRNDPQRRPTVLDLVDVRDYIYPVGRLDFDSEGLLILTNDGELAARLTHPRYGVERVYEARVLGVPDAHDLRRLSRGIIIEGQRTSPARVELLPGKPQAAQATLRIAIHEGRNRQVRKMCEAIGHPVDHLRRVAIGPIRDNRLKPGQYRDLTDDEVARLRAAAKREVTEMAEVADQHGGTKHTEKTRRRRRVRPRRKAGR